MAKISPFKALRPAAELASKVASRPYDVLNSKEAKTEAQGNSYSFLHVTKSEISLPDNLDIHSRKYTIKPGKTCLHLYSETFFSEKASLVIISTNW
jgi:uncharacterized protein (DUF1015 family)